MKGSHAPQEYVDAIKYFRCDACVLTGRASTTHPVAAPSHYAFNHKLHVDVLTLHDVEGVRWHSSRLYVKKVVCLAAKCLQKFMSHWVSWAGWPKIVTTDRGTHNRGVFARTLAKNGVYVRPVGLESPEHLGRGESHGDMFKTNMKRIIREHHLTSKEHIKMAVAESISERNEYLH